MAFCLILILQVFKVTFVESIPKEYGQFSSELEGSIQHVSYMKSDTVFGLKKNDFFLKEDGCVEIYHETYRPDDVSQHYFAIVLKIGRNYDTINLCSYKNLITGYTEASFSDVKATYNVMHCNASIAKFCNFDMRFEGANFRLTEVSETGPIVYLSKSQIHYVPNTNDGKNLTIFNAELRTLQKFDLTTGRVELDAGKELIPENIKAIFIWPFIGNSGQLLKRSSITSDSIIRFITNNESRDISIAIDFVKSGGSNIIRINNYHKLINAFIVLKYQNKDDYDINLALEPIKATGLLTFVKCYSSSFTFIPTLQSQDYSISALDSEGYYKLKYLCSMTASRTDPECKKIDTTDNTIEVEMHKIVVKKFSANNELSVSFCYIEIDEQLSPISNKACTYLFLTPNSCEQKELPTQWLQSKALLSYSFAFYQLPYSYNGQKLTISVIPEGTISTVSTQSSIINSTEYLTSTRAKGEDKGTKSIKKFFVIAFSVIAGIIVVGAIIAIMIWLYKRKKLQSYSITQEY